MMYSSPPENRVQNGQIKTKLRNEHHKYEQVAERVHRLERPILKPRTWTASVVCGSEIGCTPGSGVENMCLTAGNQFHVLTS